MGQTARKNEQNSIVTRWTRLRGVILALLVDTCGEIFTFFLTLGSATYFSVFQKVGVMS